MQTYNYKCNDCGKNFEVKATLKEKETKTFSCPQCKSENTKSQFSLTKFLKNAFGKSEADKPCYSGDSCCGSKPDETDKKKCC